MSRIKRILAMLIVLSAILIVFPSMWLYCEVEQEEKDRALIAAITSGDNPMILKLLAAGASGEARDTGKPRPYLETLFLLVSPFRHHSVPPSVQTNDDHPPALLLLYQVASYKGNGGVGPDLAVVRSLLEHGAHVNDQLADGRSPLWYAMWYSNCDIVTLLLARGANTDVTGVNEYAPLLHGNSEVIQLLLNHGAKVDAGNKLKYTPLIWAAMGDKPDVVRILLEHGANIEAMDVKKKTPLIWATERDNPDVVRILLENGANVSAKDADGYAALDYIRYGKDDFVPRTDDQDSLKIAVLLRKYGAK